MTTYTTLNPTRNRISWAAVVALCAVYVVTGLVGHEPWKPDEAYTVGIVADFLEHGDWVVPTLADEPFLEKPPLFFVTAGLFARTFGTWLPLHDAARLAAGFYVVLALTFLALTATELYGRRARETAILAMIGCFGLIFRSHQAITDTALLAGLSIGIYGLARTIRGGAAGGIALGVGAAIAFLSKGLLGPGLLGLSALLLPLFEAWRRRSYAWSLALALIVAIPVGATWALALYIRSPELFHTWLFTNNLDRFFGTVTIGPHNEALFYFRILPWYAFPALPLAIGSVWMAIRNPLTEGNAARLQLPLVVFGVMLIVLVSAHDSRELYAMPMLLPLALLTAAGIDRLPVMAARVLTWTAWAFFGAVALTLWVGWIALLTGEPMPLQRLLETFQPGFVLKFHWRPFAVALIATLVWLGLASSRSRTGRSSIFQWTAALTTCWVLASTLWFPYVDAGKSYRAMVDSVARVLPAGGCVASVGLGEPQRAMLDYYHDIETVRIKPHSTAPCDWLFVQGWRATGAPAPSTHWILVWEGNRSGDWSELYRLYKRERRGGRQPGAVPGSRFVDGADVVNATMGREHSGGP